MIAIVVTVVVTRLYGNRRTKLVVDTRNVRKMAVRLRTEDGEVIVIEPNPPVQYIVQIRVENLGPDDIRVADFNGDPLVFLFGARTAGIQMSNMGILLDVKEGRGELSPRQIPKGASWHWEVHTLDEYPRLRVSSGITNVDINLRQHRDAEGYGAMLGSFGFSGSQDWWKGRVLRH
ncbi:MAG: hypothetical protein WAV45_01565 [Propionibacteriaceae bacterium]